MKKICIFIIIIIGLGSYYYSKEVYPYNWDEAEKNFQLYIKEQNVDKNNIESIKKSKFEKTGAIEYLVKYKDDKGLVYQYLYKRGDTMGLYNINLIICNEIGDEIGNTTPHKYPILEKNDK